MKTIAQGIRNSQRVHYQRGYRAGRKHGAKKVETLCTAAETLLRDLSTTSDGERCLQMRSADDLALLVKQYQEEQTP